MRPLPTMHSDRINRFRRLRFIGSATIFAGVLVWSIAALSFWGFARHHQGVMQARFIDVLLPPFWPNFRRALGDHQIEEAKRLVLSQAFSPAAMRLRLGIAHSPANVEGRLLLARLYVAGNRLDQARDVLVDGLRHAPRNLSYLAAVLEFNLRHRPNEETEALCARLANEPPPDPARSRLVALAWATAAFNQGHYRLAGNLLKEHRIQSSGDGLLLQARLDWELGHRELAVIRLETVSTAPGRANDAALAQLAQYYRALGRLDAAERCTVVRLAGDPLAAAPRIELLRLRAERGDAAGFARQSEAMLAGFADDGPALLALSDLAANTGHPELAERILALCLARGHPTEGPALTVIEALLVAGQLQTSLDRLASTEKLHPDWAEKHAAFFLGLQAVALHALGRHGEADAALDRLFDEPDLGAEVLVSVARRLLAVGAGRPARTVFEHAARVDPQNQAILLQLVRLELDTDPADVPPDHLSRLFAIRRPPNDLLEAAARKIGSDRCLFHPGQAALLAEIAAALSETASSVSL